MLTLLELEDIHDGSQSVNHFVVDDDIILQLVLLGLLGFLSLTIVVVVEDFKVVEHVDQEVVEQVENTD